MTEPDREIDWSVTTWEGSRREQIRRWRALTVRQRLEALDEMTELAETLANAPPRPTPPLTAPGTLGHLRSATVARCFWSVGGSPLQPAIA